MSTIKRISSWHWWVSVLAAGVLVGLAGDGRASSSERGRCEVFDFDGFFEQDASGNKKRDGNGVPVLAAEGVVAFLIRHGQVPRAKPSDTGDQVSLPLDFNQVVRIADFQKDKEGMPQRNGWAQIMKQYPGEPIGWVPLADLHCGSRPLIDEETSLDIKAFTRPETAEVELKSRVYAFPAPELEGCDPSKANSCRELTKFQLYFVMDQRGDALLLSRAAQLDPNRGDQLVGWIRRKDALIWNTALELRPHDRLGDAGSSTNHLCGYVTQADARSKRDCQPIVGGRQWFERKFYLPVVETHGDKPGNPELYEVAITSKLKPAGRPTEEDRGEVSTGAGSIRSFFEPGDLEDPIERRIDASGLRSIDVFFLIDGTYSMKHWIQAIVGAEDQPGLISILEQRIAEEMGKGIKVRLGFRTFTDTFEGRDSLGPHYSLPDLGEDCGGQSVDQVNRHNAGFHQALETALRKVTRGVKGDDYWEDLYGGIDQALTDMKGCKDHLKLLIIIGDGGYSPDAQRQRGLQPFELSDLLRKAETFSRALLYVVRPSPTDRQPGRKTGESPKEYQMRLEARAQARKDFETQGQELVVGFAGRILESVRKKVGEDAQRQVSGDRPVGGRYVNLDFGNQESSIDFVNEIVTFIRGSAQPDALAEFNLDLSTGASVIEAIARLDLAEDDVPALLWKQTLAADACRRLGRQCTERVFDYTGTLFVRPDESFTLGGRKKPVPSYVLGAQLRQVEFYGIKDFVSGIARSSFTLTEYKRQQLRDLMLSEAEALLRQKGVNEREPMDILTKGANLPVRTNSPLLQYGNEELSGDHRPLCEIDALIAWVRNVDTMLQIVQDGRFRPSLDPDELAGDLTCPGYFYNDARCPGISEKGKRIPLLLKPVETRRLDPDNSEASFQQSYAGDVYYHLPQCYLP